MSVKSLLQLILLLLIFVIIGGIYFLYFYSGNTNTDIKNKVQMNEIKKTDSEINTDEELVSLISDQKNKGTKEISTNSNTLNQEESVEKEKSNNENKLNEKNIANLTKEIEYLTTDGSGNNYKIFAKYGKTNLNNKNILDLEIVRGEVLPINRSVIYIKSDYAKYDNNDQSSLFYGNVKINYENKEINCDNFNINMKENTAVAYENVVVFDNKSIMNAEKISLDIVTKDISINSENKVKILSN